MRQCSASNAAMPCWALPVSSCFGREDGWTFSVDFANPNWKRNLQTHEALHQTHLHQGELLVAQATKVKRLAEENAWECRRCGLTLPTLHKAAHHVCAQTIRRKQMHQPVAALCRSDAKRRRNSQAPQALQTLNLSVFSAPEDLPCASIMERFLVQRGNSEALAQLSPASMLLTEYAAAVASPESQLRVGDFFEWPAGKATFGCVFSINAAGKYHAVQFKRRPVDVRRPCAMHADQNGCWRAVLPLVSHEIDMKAGLRRVTLVPRPKQTRGYVSLGERCFALCDTPSAGAPQSKHFQHLKEFVTDAAQLALQGFDNACPSATPAVLQVLKECTTRQLQALRVPACCPAALDGKPCQIRPHGFAPSRLLVTAQGCFRVIAERYDCRTHGRTWTLPGGDNTSGCNLAADVVGDFLFDRDWWPVAVSLFLQTESFVAVERQTRRQTATAVAAVFSQQALRHTMSDIELAFVQQGLLAHCRKTPQQRTVKNFLCAWHINVVRPAVLGLAQHCVGMHGCVLNIDFSASDSRQLTRKRRQAKDSRRTMGSITGLDDVPLLPPLFVDSERRFTVEILCFTAMKLLKAQGMRPIGLNTDDITAWFETITGCLEAAYPGVVKCLPASNTVHVNKHLASGGIVIHRRQQVVRGFELGQDPLHWYQRLLRDVNVASQDCNSEFNPCCACSSLILASRS